MNRPTQNKWMPKDDAAAVSVAQFLRELDWLVEVHDDCDCRLPREIAQLLERLDVDLPDEFGYLGYLRDTRAGTGKKRSRSARED